ncbi:hypothetical protein GRI39_03800 [Altererythrobacter indicus]|uniref:Secreted protein n=1 Tax=Altericroceibacterium indicum TaxID=374177 RepID=A0A845A6I9_9SPHN|nr:hypothetical protein [Altericroceibacterium indicum]MXP25167.1 hypothetical protein [Altericroceibacterium indicum]
MSTRKYLIGALAALGVMNSSAAFAQSCIKETEVKAMTLYALPTIISAAQSKCANTLPADGFMATQASQLAARYEAKKDSNWPTARKVLIALASQGNGNADQRMGQILEQMPPATVKELLDSMLFQKLSEEIKPSKCVMIEHGLEIAAPLEPDETASIFAFVMTLAAPEKLNICPLDKK